MTRGRPTKFKSEYIEQARKLCLLGATDKELADFFEVTESTINEWKLKHSDFSESLKKGKILADAEVADKLFQRAKGFVAPDTDIRVLTVNGVQKIVKTQVAKVYPPDTTAGIFWLKNRQRDKWRDKQDIDHQSSDGSMSPQKQLSDEELMDRLKELGHGRTSNQLDSKKLGDTGSL